MNRLFYLALIASTLFPVSPAMATRFDGAAKFTDGPNTTCINATVVTNPATFQLLNIPDGFRVEGNLNLVGGRNAPCMITWTIQRTLDEPAALFINTSVFSGIMNIPQGGRVLKMTERTDHTQEGGNSAAIAIDDNMGRGYGPGIGQNFGAGPATVRFNHGAGAGDALRQSFTIELTPSGNPDDFFFFRFPVTSQTAPIPEPSTWLLVGSGLVAFVSLRNKCSRRV